MLFFSCFVLDVWYVRTPTFRALMWVICSIFSSYFKLHNQTIFYFLSVCEKLCQMWSMTCPKKINLQAMCWLLPADGECQRNSSLVEEVWKFSPCGVWVQVSAGGGPAIYGAHHGGKHRDAWGSQWHWRREHVEVLAAEHARAPTYMCTLIETWITSKGYFCVARWHTFISRSIHISN